MRRWDKNVRELNVYSESEIDAIKKSINKHMNKDITILKFYLDWDYDNFPELDNTSGYLKEYGFDIDLVIP